MTAIYVDATTLIGLGTIGELAALDAFDATPVLLSTVEAEVTTDPAKTNLQRAQDRETVQPKPSEIEFDDDQAKLIMDEDDVNGDVRIIAAVLAHTDTEDDVAVVSDNRRVRTVARGLGAEVTGTIGVLVRAVEAGRYDVGQAKQIVRRLDAHGLHMTAALREKAVDLLENATD